MNNKIVLSLGLAFMLFSGCGGSSDNPNNSKSQDSSKSSNSKSDTGTGYYIDSAVAGVDYKCGDKQSGVTDKDGKFTFEKGKDCSFSVAGVELRKVEATKLADNVKIVEDKPEVAAFLQSIDIDGNVSNGIDIKPEVLAVLKESLKNHKTVPTDNNLTNVVNEVKNSVNNFKGEAVTKEKAMEHVKGSQASVVKELLGGKTLYLVGQDVSDTTDVWGGKVVFDKSLKSVTYTEIFGDGETEKENFSKVEGNKIIINDNRYYIVEKRSNYISMVSYRDGNKSSNHRLYDSKAKAEAYYKSLNEGSNDAPANSLKFTKDMVAGKTFYIVTYNDFGIDGALKWNMAKMQFTDSKMTWSEYDTDDSSPHTFDYTIENGKVVVHEEHSSPMKLLDNRNGDYMRVVFDDKQEDSYLFYDYQKAKSFRDKKNSSFSNGGSVSNDHIAITQEMLDGKTFYFSRPDGEDMDYKKMSFSNGTYYAAKVNVNKDGTVGNLESIKFTYTLENGYIRYTTDKEVGHMVLKSKDNSTWNVRFQAIDDPSNGTDVVLYLTKPANFPSAL